MARRKLAEDSPLPSETLAVEEHSADETLVLSQESAEALADVAPSVSPSERRARVWPLFAGGVFAAALGFGAAVGAYRFAPQIFAGASSSGTEQRLSDQDKRLSDLAAQLAGMSSDQPGESAETTAALAEQAAVIASLQATQKDLTEQINGLTARLKQLESLPVTETDANAANVAAAAQTATQAAKIARAEAEKLQDEARAVARDADLTGALASLTVALEGGEPLNSALEKLAGLGVAVPQALTSQSQGVPTLTALRDSFPQAAREALALSLPDTAGDSLWGRMTAFLRSQSGARSLTPRAGDDPDAILSRAEAFLGTGDLTAALAEVGHLPEAGRARMAEWTGLAERRQAALSALAELQAEVP